ncbi:hypothetical protein RPMA_15040 [Tardiphaga alba]|uniref:Uncharacterized protein n=1 Tax=Tardiphaga alba TaxID=340268 RepID=A0ABX8A9Q4_9BRAD|nr:hypothetical protein [Tardiphaga alba]QUS39997.1 hypothetical protein RPMA_15040 [Tardiphaga alba]
MAIYETTSYAQMRRCRMAHLYGEMIDERFSAASDSTFVGGYVHAVRPDLTCWPLRWEIVVEGYPVAGRAMALAG